MDIKTKKKINKEEITPLDQYLKLHDKYVKYVNNLKFRIETIVIILKVKQLMQLQDGPSKV